MMKKLLCTVAIFILAAGPAFAGHKDGHVDNPNKGAGINSSDNTPNEGNKGGACDAIVDGTGSSASDNENQPNCGSHVD